MTTSASVKTVFTERIARSRSTSVSTVPVPTGPGALISRLEKLRGETSDRSVKTLITGRFRMSLHAGLDGQDLSNW